MRLLAACCGACLLVACSTAPAPPVGSRVDPLADAGRWRLQGATDADGGRIDAAFPHGTAVHALVFDDGRVALEGGCNHIGGDYRIDAGGRLVIGPLQSTLMACTDDARMEADAAVSDLVQGASEWRIAESWPEQLFLDHDDGRRSHWVADRPLP